MPLGLAHSDSAATFPNRLVANHELCTAVGTDMLKPLIPARESVDTGQDTAEAIKVRSIWYTMLGFYWHGVDKVVTGTTWKILN